MTLNMDATGEATWLDAPETDNTVRVRMIDTTSNMLLKSKIFIEPVLPGRELMSMPDMSFLIENPRLQRKAVFDLGVRKDFWNLAPPIKKNMDMIAKGLKVERDVPEILRSNGIELDQVDDIIWSHSHWDHTGDPSLFPHSTTLNFGPGLSSIKPGYPEDEEGRHPSSDFKGRKTHEISFTTTDLKIGGFHANDFYGDGSFYLLETPGHSQGHMCALARVGKDSKTNRSTFVLLGGDVCHFCGDMRPSALWPLSKDKEPLLEQHPQFPRRDPNGPPMTDEEKAHRSVTPWYRLSTDKGTAYNFPSTEVAQRTVDNLAARFDSARNVFVALAHDIGLLQTVPTLNDQPERDMNDWYERGWKEVDRWSWMDNLDSGNEANRLVDGFHKDGVRYDTMKDLLDSIGREKL